MPIDTKRLSRKRDEVKRASKQRDGGDLWNLDEGEYLVYVHPQCYPDDDNELTRGYNFIECFFHYQVGGKKGGQVCLDMETNPILGHPLIQQFLAKRKTPVEITSKTVCPVCNGIQTGDIPEEKAARQRANAKWIFGVTPMYYRRYSEDQWARLRFEPKVFITGVTVFNQLTGSMISLDPTDPTDPKAAILMNITRSGKGFDDTEYTVNPDPKTIVKPVLLDKGQRKIIAEAIKAGGSCDLFKVVSNLTKSPSALRAQMLGVDTEERKAEVSDDPERKECFGVDWEADDDECKACQDRQSCMELVKGVSGSIQPEDTGRGVDDNDSGDQQVDDDDQPESLECWGQFEEDDEGCKECEGRLRCAAVLSAHESATANDPNDDDGSGDDDNGEETPEDGAEDAQDAEVVIPDDDPELAQLEAEAARLANKKTTGGKKKASRSRR